uniref:U6 snRNA-associated Sm-like protein LSm1 n=1 Tax=Aureoumbra lagunensis TaxID=44058 RepID=A0A7S3JX99_9STRA|mmetsp:Transcript_8951/g.10952  ORF Transcript_8951/g.10952 Transcript_8951/m.10952 type:complete len:122 (-) Transcript_8951:115-480(-)|eukprot:CAMPEP_0197290290 /NCGR_PEP_ID=MMETSP0890-20130614/7519_1 /TAXON_ID=44058 ORGANISM="Aureoumbra lagunensis, Strain CCMP1510" /NCGR_SAMPLE_ID=MMETSP0890 /ASSEMBLY_ACC=CAM_ASM_000533 /LENGTH=121 /DNA_ID=CAMNT_0042762211 /DNA_START=31 /DNA_END=396 /DNA_ORIENTATION=+
MPIALPAAASLVDQLDKKVMILLRDGRHLVGIMRSFDQFSNLVLEETFERRVVVSASGTSHYGDIPLGLYVVRGDAVILLGEVDADIEESESYPKLVAPEEIIALEETVQDPIQTPIIVDD